MAVKVLAGQKFNGSSVDRSAERQARRDAEAAE